MKRASGLFTMITVVGISAMRVSGSANIEFEVQNSTTSQPVRIAGAPCDTPPALRCDGLNCPVVVVTNGGSVVEPKTGRTYFHDYPCDLKSGEKVTFILRHRV